MLLQILHDEFAKRKKRNANYSMRAFARSLKIHSSTLSAILSEKRKISPRQAQKILVELGIGSKDRKAILLRMMNEKNETQIPEYKVLSADVLAIISGWEHFALMACIDLDSGEKTTRYLADKMKIPEAMAQEALQRLEQCGLVRLEGAAWVTTGHNLTTTNEMVSEPLRKVHREYIQKSLVSLDKDSIDDRDITGITMAISSKKLAAAKKMIASFRRELADFLEGDTKDEVYRFNVQLFPLSK